MISCHIKKFLIILIRKLCFQTFSSMSLYHIIISISARKIQLFSVLLKILKSLTHSTDKYLVNFVKNQKRISHLFYTEMKL